MNYKKSILSLVAIMALSGTASADDVATYIPLTSDDYDASWTLFGVNGFSTGIASARGVSSDGFSAGLVSVKEDTGETQDADATCGLGTWPLSRLCVQVVDDVTITELEVATSAEQPFEGTEPVRSMYIKINSNTPNVKIDYKSSLEGQTLEMLVNEGSTLYAVTLSEDNTYSNAAIAVESSQVASSDPKLSNIVDVIDYNFKDNPLEAKYFSANSHLNTKADMKLSNPGTAEAESAIFYHFDSISQQWKIWDSKFSGGANDFTTFSKGDAYWGLIDTNNDTPLTNDSSDLNVTASGLILGSSGLSAPDETVYAGKLADGWNMISLDDVKPYIRHAATGLTATFGTTAEEVNGTIVLTDSSGLHALSVDLNDTETSTQMIASKINVTIDRAKLAGDIPSSFNVRAFRTGTSTVTFISDAKFSLTDGDDKNNISTVKTLTNAEPYNATATRTAITDLNTSKSTATDGSEINAEVTSAYGEYAVILDLLTDGLANDGAAQSLNRVAADLDAIASNGDTAVSAMIRIGTTDKDYPALGLVDDSAAGDAAVTVATAATQILTHDLFDGTDGTGKLTEIDSNGNGFSDRVILASTVPFYVKDNTYTRSFEDDNTTNDGIRSFNIVGSETESVVGVLNGTHVDNATLIMGKSGTTGVYADVNDTSNTNHLIAVSTTLSTFDIKDLEDGDNGFFINTVSSTPLAKGAVAGVYALDEVAKLDLVPDSVTFSNIAIPDSLNTSDDYESNITIIINGMPDINITLEDINATTTESNITAYFDTIVSSVNVALQEQNLTAYAYHTYIDGTTASVTDAVDLVIRGFDINTSTTMTYDTNNTAQAVTSTDNTDVNGTTVSGVFIPGARTLGASWPTLVADLKSNAVYTPNYASYGPLYTLNNAGYSVRSILKATTRFSDEAIAWDGIDLTRDEDDWFVNNEFNLFSADVHSGYWVYLQAKAADSVSIGAATFTPTYTYYFDNKDASNEYPTSNIINGGQFSVQITGFDGGISSAYVSIAGTEVQLKRNGTSDEYTADFTKYSIANFNEGGSGDVSFTVRATDGKGEDVSLSGAYTFDYTAPILAVPVATNNKTVTFNADGNTSDVSKFYVYKEYIPELDASRASATATTNRLVGSYDATAGSASTNVCTGLSFGDVNNLRVVGVDGAGAIGSANVSDAIQFVYATMLNGSEVLTHVAGSTDDKAIIGLRYDSACTALATQPTLATENKGVSLKTLVGTSTARLAYEMIDGLGSSLSGAFLATYSIGGVDVIQVQNLEEYAGKPFFVEYGGKMYRSAFPSTSGDAAASSVTAIELDASTAFTLDATTGLRVTTGGTGNELSSSLLNNTLAP